MCEDDGLPGLLGGQQLELLRAFCDRFREDRAMAPRVSLETLIDRAVTRSGYDRHLLALPQGERRMANVRKLMRMAREFEADEGRDLRGFIDFVAERDLVQAGEGQAPLEAEDLDAVRLMTVHRAKGLEFPLVCVADLGKLGREDDAALRVTDDGRMGMRLASMSGVSVDTAEMDRIKEEQKAADEEEERRIFYVAATRAEEHLVLSGATDLEKLQEPEPTWPSRCAGCGARWPRASTRWRARGWSAGDYEGREVRVACRVLRPADVDALLPAADRRPVRARARAARPRGAGRARAGGGAGARGAAGQPPELLRAWPPTGAAATASTWSARCGCRRPTTAPRAPPAAATPGTRCRRPCAARGPPAARGGGLHRARGARAPSASAEVIEALGQPVRAEEVEDVTGLVAGFVGSALARADRRGRARARRAAVRLHAGHRRRAQPAGRRHRGRARARGPTRVLVVDYKSDRLEGAEPAERVEGAYAIQQLVYALAALRSGAARAEVAYCFLERPDEPGDPRLRGRGGRRARGRAARAHRRGVRGPVRAHRRSPTAACAPTAPAARRCAAGTRTARWPSRSARR